SRLTTPAFRVFLKQSSRTDRAIHSMPLSPRWVYTVTRGVSRPLRTHSWIHSSTPPSRLSSPWSKTSLPFSYGIEMKRAAAQPPPTSFRILLFRAARLRNVIPPVSVQDDVVDKLKLVGLDRVGLAHPLLLGADLGGDEVHHIALYGENQIQLAAVH